MVKEIVDHLPPRRDLMRIARYVGSLRRPSRAELLLYGLAGAVIGAGIALLLTPERGSELRSRIGDRVEKYMRTAEEHEPDGHDRAERA